MAYVVFYGRNLRTGIPERIGRPLYLRFIRILRFDLSIIIRTFRYCKCIFRERHIGVVYKVFKFKYFLIKQPGSRERCDFRNALRMEPPCFADRRSDRLRGFFFFLGLKSKNMDTTEMMMTDKLNSGLIESMKEKIPEGANLANLLMDILYIGKEAVYRRLRGEVPFTFTEAAVISQKLGVSLDQLIGANFGGNALFRAQYRALCRSGRDVLRDDRRLCEDFPGIETRARVRAGDFVQHHSADALYEVRYVVSFPAVQMDVPA